MHILSVVVRNQSLEMQKIGSSRAPKKKSKTKTQTDIEKAANDMHHVMLSHCSFQWKHSTDRICISLALYHLRLCVRDVHTYMSSNVYSFWSSFPPLLLLLINEFLFFYQIVKWNKFVVIRWIGGRNAIGFIYTWQTKTNELNLFATQCTELSPAIGVPNADRPNTCAMIACAKSKKKKNTREREKRTKITERRIHMRTATVIII